jgi:hypothetical protein
MRKKWQRHHAQAPFRFRAVPPWYCRTVAFSCRLEHQRAGKKSEILAPKPSFGSFCLIVSKMADFLGAGQGSRTWQHQVLVLSFLWIMFEPKSPQTGKRVPFSFLFPSHGVQVREGKCVGVVECSCC